MHKTLHIVERLRGAFHESTPAWVTERVDGSRSPTVVDWTGKKPANRFRPVSYTRSWGLVGLLAFCAYAEMVIITSYRQYGILRSWDRSINHLEMDFVAWLCSEDHRCMGQSVTPKHNCVCLRLEPS
jgi:hypothetical protein